MNYADDGAKAADNVSQNFLSSRCARAGQVLGYYGVAMQIKDYNLISHSEIVTSQAKG